MSKRKFGQIPRTRGWTCDQSRENGVRGEHNQMWLVALDRGFEPNSSVKGGCLLAVARVDCWGKGITKSHLIPLPSGFYGMDDGMDGT